MRYILGVFGIIVILIVIVVLLLRIRPEQTPAVTQTGEKQVELAEYEDKAATAQYTVRGSVRAQEERRGIRISVSRSDRVIEILEGYDERVATRRTYTNNDNAYRVFLSALDQAGFSRERESDIEDDRGVCPLGQRSSYKLIDGGEDVFRTWSSTCRQQAGTLGGQKRVIQQLFERQIPDFRELTRTVRL